MKERKGLNYLVEACRILRDRDIQFECRIIGDGPLRPDLETQIQQLGLNDQVKLYGALPHEAVIEQYEQATLFTLPAIQGADGDRDGIPNVILEALAMELQSWAGMPVVFNQSLYPMPPKFDSGSQASQFLP